MSDEFDEILDRCVADIAAGRESVASCLKRYPTYAEQLAPALLLADRLRGAPPVSLPIDKRRALESRLLRQARQLRSVPADRPKVQRWRGWAVAFAAVVAVFLLLGTVTNAAASSAPGDVLYPVKRATEQLRLSLASSEQQVELRVAFVNQRLAELNILAERGDVSGELLTEISTDTAWVLEHAQNLPANSQETVLASLADFQSQRLQTLQVLAASLNGQAQTAIMAALEDARVQREETVDRLNSVTATATPAGIATPAIEPTSVDKTLPPGKPTQKPTNTKKPEPQPTTAATHVSPATPQKPTANPDHTPPGQAKQATVEKPTREPNPTKQPAATKEPKPTKTPKP